MKHILLTALPVLIAGCASTNITGYSDPAYSGTEYDSTVVFASNLDLEKAADLESSICNEFSDRGVSCTTFLSLFPPTRGHTIRLGVRNSVPARYRFLHHAH